MRRRACVALGAILVLGGCGGGDGEGEATCREDQRKSAELAVVSSLYERGELGPKEEVQAELDELAETNGEDSFFDDDGRLLSWYELERSQQSLLADWWENDPDVDRMAFEQQKEARARVAPDC